MPRRGGKSQTPPFNRWGAETHMDPVPGVMAMWEQVCIDPLLCFIDPHLQPVACFFSPSRKFPLSHFCFLQNFILTRCVPLSVLPVSVAQGQEVLHDAVLLPSHLLPSEKRRGAQSWRYLCCCGWLVGLGEVWSSPLFGALWWVMQVCNRCSYPCLGDESKGLHLAVAWLQMVLVTPSSLHSCGQTDQAGFLPNSACDNHKTIKWAMCNQGSGIFLPWNHRVMWTGLSQGHGRA